MAVDLLLFVLVLVLLSPCCPVLVPFSAPVFVSPSPDAVGSAPATLVLPLPSSIRRRCSGLSAEDAPSSMIPAPSEGCLWFVRGLDTRRPPLKK